MDLLDGIAAPTRLPIAAVVIRLVVAMAFGAVIGLEREWQKRPAGLRTHMLTALAAAVFTILGSETLRSDMFPPDMLQSDPLRLIEAVTAGVAFLAAGTIIRYRGSIHGLTTGAGMWLAGALGVAAGLGHLVIGAVAAVLGLVIIGLVRLLEDRPDEVS